MGAGSMNVYVVTDCKGILGGWEKGEERRFMEGAAALWRRSLPLRRILSRRGILFHLYWSRAHQTVERMRAGIICVRDWQGNDWAVKIAKQEAGDALDRRAVSNYLKELATVVAWLRWCILGASMLL